MAVYRAKFGIIVINKKEMVASIIEQNRFLSLHTVHTVRRPSTFDRSTLQLGMQAITSSTNRTTQGKPEYAWATISW